MSAPAWPTRVEYTYLDPQGVEHQGVWESTEDPAGIADRAEDYSSWVVTAFALLGRRVISARLVAEVEVELEPDEGGELPPGVVSMFGERP